jgi:hypothetical protein
MARKHEDPASALDSRIDGLYAEPLSSFVTARNALAGELRRTDPAASATVKALARPTITAWAINQVYWHARPDYDRLLEAGDELRRLQQQVLFGRGADTREATDGRQQAIRRVTDRAAAFLAQAGHPASDTVRQRLAVTADAIAAFGSHPAGFTHGRLERELDPPGFEALASLGAPALRLVKSARQAPTAPEPTAPKPAPTAPAAHRAGPSQAERDRKGREAEQQREREEREQRRALEQSLKEAEREVRVQQERAARAAREVQERDARFRELRTRRERLQRDLERAQAAEDDADRQLQRARADAESATTAHAAAVQAEQHARRALDAAAVRK